ncbi:MAG: long-chain fatty acid--CoA ligase [Kiloniellales bacterium]
MDRLRRALGRLLAFRGAPAEVETPVEPGPFPWERAYPAGIDWHFAVEPKPLFAILDEAVAAHGDRPCLYFMGKAYSYAQVGALVARTTRGLQDLGVKPGVKVGLFLPNTPYYVICYYAILKAGGMVVNFNPLYAEREIARQIRDSEVQIMVTLNLVSLYGKVVGRLSDTKLEKIVVCGMGGVLPLPKKALFAFLRRKEISSTPADGRHVKFEKLIDNAGDCGPVEIDPASDIAVLQYTGGTTGHPKGAMLTHACLYANTLQTRLWGKDIEPGAERILGVLPLFHAFGMTGVMNAGIVIGAEIVLLPRFNVAEVLATIDKRQPTIFFGVPTIYSAINTHRDLEKYDLSSLKFCVSGGAPLAQEIKRTFEQLSGCILVEGYGLTEAGPVCTINPFDGVNKPGSAGLPIPGTIIEIVSLDDPSKRLPIGQVGEVCVSGPQVMAGYWKQKEETDGCLSDGRLRTGDVGYLDEDGYLFLIDRIKDLIITGGYNVYPSAVEEAFYLHPAVEEAVVCGLPDRHHGEIVAAFVRLRAGQRLSVGELRRFLKDKLASFEQPRRIIFRDEIPRSALGKPLRRELVKQEMSAERHAPAPRPAEDEGAAAATG